MENTKNNMSTINKRTIGNWFIIAGILIITTLEWHFFDWYQTFTRYGTLITFIALVGAFFCYVDIREVLKDKQFYFMAITDAIAMLNLFIIGSNKGCILIVMDFMLVLYLSDKVVFSKREAFIVLIYTAFFFIYWTIDVKGYFKGYNTNYGGLILITGFAFLVIILQVVNERLMYRYGLYVGEYGKNEGRRYWIKRFFWYPALYLFLFALAFNIISWYRSRTALMGLIILVLLVLMPRKIVANKVIYPIICVLSTAGAIVLSVIYILLGKLSEGDGIQLFYKSIISGRNDIWSELLNAFSKHPITGIGSSYEMQLDFMAGSFEAHGAMMDILVVHGGIVFVLLCGYFVYKLLTLKEQTGGSRLGKVIFAAITCILITGFFENYYIVQPFSLMLLALFALDTEKLNI